MIGGAPPEKTPGRGTFPAFCSAGEESARPEAFCDNDLPSKLLGRLYREKTKREYKKRSHGAELFSRLDPDRAAAKCPALKALLDDLPAFAQTANT